MKKTLKIISVAMAMTFVMLVSSIPAFAATDIYTVQKGDSLWKISLKYQVGLSEIIEANPQFENPNLIYPGDKVTVPLDDPSVKSLEEQVVDLVNKERAKYGLNPLILNWQLARVGRYKSKDMIENNYFGHESPTYGSPFEMLKKFNLKYQVAGENIAKGQRTAKSVMSAWMSSEGHRKNILSSSYTEIGVGYAADNSSTYWTQLFIKP